VATDIAARGIHVDDVRIVIHADPPSEAKAYLHRSGRTGRAGATGTIVTLSTEAQRGEVRALTAQAGIKPTATRIAPGHPLLRELAPGPRTFVRLDHPASGRRGGSTVESRAVAGRSAADRTVADGRLANRRGTARTRRSSQGGAGSSTSVQTATDATLATATAARYATGHAAAAMSARTPRRRARG
jgi:superfamily II DNA/RNA helicase